MMKNHLLLLIALFAALTGYALTGRAQTENTKLPELKGEWKLDSIVKIQGENRVTALSPGKIIPDSIYYSCPVKIRFKEQVGSCQLLYENEETKNVSFSIYKFQDSVHLQVLLFANQGSMPEWQFDYFLSATQTRLIIMIEYILESPDEKFQYNYFYSSIKQIYN